MQCLCLALWLRGFLTLFINLTIPLFVTLHPSILFSTSYKSYYSLVSPSLDMHLMLMLIWHSQIRSHVFMDVSNVHLLKILRTFSIKVQSLCKHVTYLDSCAYLAYVRLDYLHLQPSFFFPFYVKQ